MIETLFSVDGQICVITGGSRGLGAYIARGFLQAGAKRVYIAALAKCEEIIDMLVNHADLEISPTTS